MLQCHGRCRHQILHVQHGNIGDFGCNAIRCRVHHLTRGKENQGDMCLIGCGGRCMTDWGIANLVGCSTPHRSDRSPTSQTDLSRYWPNFILQSKNTILKRRRTKASTCRFILGRPQSMMSCRLAMSKLMSKTWKRDRWFLGNGSKSLSWTMTMKLAIATRRINTLNLGGTHQG